MVEMNVDDVGGPPCMVEMGVRPSRRVSVDPRCEDSVPSPTIIDPPTSSCNYLMMVVLTARASGFLWHC